MKKILITLFAVAICVLSVAGCDHKQDQTGGNSTENKTEISSDTEKNETSTSDNASETETQTETETPKNESPYSANCIVKKGNRYVIVLPMSNYSIPVDRDFVKYLSSVSDELVLAAEAKITEQVTALGETPDWYISSHDGKEMCLMVEVIKFAEDADYMEEGGCGIDHEHVFFAESIIEQ